MENEIEQKVDKWNQKLQELFDWADKPKNEIECGNNEE